MCCNPIRLKLKTKIQSYGVFDVPCGLCPSCLKTRQYEWIPRLYYQLKSSSSCQFITFTYNEQKVPRVIDYSTGVEYKSLRKRDFQLFLKKIRMRYHRQDNHLNFSYFLCGEYGPTTKRPHYHCLFFDLTEEQANYIVSEWSKEYGFALAKSVDIKTGKSLYNTAKYLTKYSMKGIYAHPEYRINKVPNPNYTPYGLEPKYLKVMPIVEPAFRVMSKGIGKSYLTEKMVNFHLATDKDFVDSDEQAREIFKRKNIEFYTDNNDIFKTPLSRYYREKIFGKSDLLKDAIFRAFIAFRNELRSRELSQLQGEERIEEKNCILDMLQSEKESLSAAYDSKQHLEWYSKSKF